MAIVAPPLPFFFLGGPGWLHLVTYDRVIAGGAFPPFLSSGSAGAGREQGPVTKPLSLPSPVGNR